jgi:hypothetical protein
VSPNRHAQGLNLGYPDPEGKLVVAWDFIGSSPSMAPGDPS